MKFPSLVHLFNVVICDEETKDTAIKLWFTDVRSWKWILVRILFICSLCWNSYMMPCLATTTTQLSTARTWNASLYVLCTQSRKERQLRLLLGHVLDFLCLQSLVLFVLLRSWWSTLEQHNCVHSTCIPRGAASLTSLYSKYKAQEWVMGLIKT